MKLEWSRAALADLDRFAEFLGETFPGLAPIVAEAIVRKAEALVAHPLMGRPIPGRERFRQIVLRVIGADYVFEYRQEGERIVIVRVFHARERR